MLAIEDLLSELAAGEEATEQGLPPGFRFHPTDEELITFYLASKIFNSAVFFGVHIAEVDLNRCEPWELPERAKMGEREWYFYSLRDRKYPTGLRTNRATAAGYWKATGKDKEVYSRSSPGAGNLVGMKKTLVFYKGRAPRGVKTKWVMHEYRLEPALSIHHTCKEEWVICRVFHKAGEKKNVGIQIQIQNPNFAQFHPQVNESLPLLETPKSLNQNGQHENPQLKTLTTSQIPKRCKTESVVHPGSHGGQRYSDELNYSFQDPLFHNEGYNSLLSLAPSPEDDDVAAALNRVGFHIMLDSLPSGFPTDESWPLI